MNKFFNYSFRIDNFSNNLFDLYFICKNCGEEPLSQSDESTGVNYWCLTPYCPTCGHRMFDYNCFIHVPNIYKETEENMFDKFKRNVVYEDIWKPVLYFIDNYRKNNCKYKFTVFSDSFVGIDNSFYTAYVENDDFSIFYSNNENKEKLLEEIKIKKLPYKVEEYKYDRKTFWN